MNKTKLRDTLYFTPDSIRERINNEKWIGGLAEHFGVESSEILKQLSLHCPRLTWNENHDAVVLAAEAAKHAQRIRKKLDSLDWDFPKPISFSELKNAKLEIVPENIVRDIHENLHYIYSYRPDSLTLGVYSQRTSIPYAIFTYSAFDMPSMRPLFPDWLEDHEILSYSRGYAFPAIPANAISFFMAKARKKLMRERPDIKLLTTNINPNIGFSGASFRGENWMKVARENGTRYAYLNGDYTTDRGLIERFGTCDYGCLSGITGFSVSIHELKPLDVWCRLLSEDPKLKEWFWIAWHFPIDLMKPTRYIKAGRMPKALP